MKLDPNSLDQRLFANDLRAMLALTDARKAENAARRAACMADKGLESLLRSEAERRGEVFSWVAYFRDAGIA